MSFGKMKWAVAEGYIPPDDEQKQETQISHETICILNPSESEAHVDIMIYYSDREPAGPYQITIEGERTSHIRFNELKDPAPIPKGTDFSSIITSDVPIIVQHTRLDSRWNSNALLSTIAYSE